MIQTSTYSVLVPGPQAAPTAVDRPASFRDLDLDQVAATITAGRDEYELLPFFHAPLRDLDAVEYRHEVFRDLQSERVRSPVVAFADRMTRVRRQLALAAGGHHASERKRWFVDAVSAYCDAVETLAAALVAAEPQSRGLRLVRDGLASYMRSEEFTALAAETQRVLDGLRGIVYAVRIKGARVTVTTYDREPDYSLEVEETFARFRQGAVEDHLVQVRDSGSMDHVEAQIAERLARLFPGEFAALDAFCAGHRSFVDEAVARFDREVQFYLAYLEFAERLERGGVAFAYPTVSTSSKETDIRGGVDVALAAKVAAEGGAVVPNDVLLHGPERMLVVTGPNQGGKTTFARMVGQLHYLAALGVPVAARSAELFLADEVCTHFEREEDVATLRGKLEDELVRLRDVLERATGDSIVVVNEIFSSTTLADAVRLGTRVLQELGDRDCLAVCVTFLDELASRGDSVVSMVAQVDPDDPSRRTFEIVRRPADGRAYALAIAEKYGLSRARLLERVRR